MRLVNPGLGEIADRLSILALKIAHAPEADRDPAHFVNERNALLVLLRSTSLETDAIRERIFELSAVNAMLWHAEDDLRGWRDQTADRVEQLGDPEVRDVARAAFRIQRLNDQRADLVHALNRLAGTSLGAEKLTPATSLSQEP